MQAQTLSVRQLYNHFLRSMDLKILTTKEYPDRFIRSQEITRPGLAFAGYFGIFSFDRIQLIGNTECGYLADVPSETRMKHLEWILRHEVPCFLLTNNNELPADMMDMCREAQIPVFRTHLPSTRVASMLIPYLEEHFAPVTTVHGELLTVFGVGCMITGESGVGKSECALDLVERGHRLIADDMIYVTTPRPNELYGNGSEMLHYNMEIRGVGVLNIQEFFGMAAIGEKTKIDVLVKLENWDENKMYDRMGLDTKTEHILGVGIPYYEVPVKPGRNLPMLVEMCCLSQRMKNRGDNPAAALQRRIAKSIKG